MKYNLVIRIVEKSETKNKLFIKNKKRLYNGISI